MAFPSVIAHCLFDTARRAFHLRVRAVQTPSQPEHSAFRTLCFRSVALIHRREPNQYEPVGGDGKGFGHCSVELDYDGQEKLRQLQVRTTTAGPKGKGHRILCNH